MMKKKVLIIYHSEYGYVTQIANFIKDRLQKKGLEVITVDVIRNQNTEVYPLEQYSGIILGIDQGVWRLKKLKKSFLKEILPITNYINVQLFCLKTTPSILPCCLERIIIKKNL